VFDFDKIEEHNLTRCVLFRDSDIGRYKAEVAAESCRQIDPHVEIYASNVDFWEGLSLDEIAKADAVVCCADNFEARLGLNQLCLMTATDFYNTGIDSRYATVEMFAFSTHPECACYNCALPPSVYNAIQKRYSCGPLRKVAFEENKIPTTAITSSMVGSIVVSLFLNRLNSHPQAIPYGAIRHFQDTITLESTLSMVQRNDDCLACKSVDPHATRMTAKRFCGNQSVIPVTGDMKGEIVLSEPVLTRGICKLCGREQDYFESTKKLTDVVTFCTICGIQSVSPEFVERLSLADFKRLFAGRSVPCKFLVYNTDSRQMILELEG